MPATPAPPPSCGWAESRRRHHEVMRFPAYAAPITSPLDVVRRDRRRRLGTLARTWSCARPGATMARDAERRTRRAIGERGVVTDGQRGAQETSPTCVLDSIPMSWHPGAPRIPALASTLARSPPSSCRGQAVRTCASAYRRGCRKAVWPPAAIALSSSARRAIWLAHGLHTLGGGNVPRRFSIIWRMSSMRALLAPRTGVFKVPPKAGFDRRVSLSAAFMPPSLASIIASWSAARWPHTLLASGCQPDRSAARWR